MRILLVEDHPALAEALADGLRKHGYVVDITGTIRETREAIVLSRYELAIVDLGLPDGNGLDLVRSLRESPGIPVLILTARGGLGDRVEGLDQGADDYIVKPVEIPELLARCRAILRRPGKRDEVTLKLGDIALDTRSREAFCKDVRLNIGRRELSILLQMLQRPNRVIPREVLLDTIYEASEEVSLNAVDAAISRLRRALIDCASSTAIETVRGIGWTLKETRE